MKYFLILLSITLIGCSSEKKNDFSILPDDQFIFPVVFHDKSYSELINKPLEFIFNTPGLHGKYMCIKNEGGLVIQAENDRSLAEIVGVRKINNELRAFYIRIARGSLDKYKGLRDNEIVFTNISKSYFRTLFPKHNGNIIYEKRDTIHVYFPIYKKFLQDSLVTLSFK